MTKTPTRRWYPMGITVRSTVLVAVAAVPMFWVTPRSGGQWELGINSRGRLKTGLSDGAVDLNRTGNLEISYEKVFTVEIRDAAGQPVVDMPADQRWRVSSYSLYSDNAQWRTAAPMLQIRDRPTPQAFSNGEPRAILPNLGPNAVFISYTLTNRAGKNAALAEPVTWIAQEPTPVISKSPDGRYSSWAKRGDIYEPRWFLTDGPPRYIQTWAPPVRPGETPAFRIAQGDADNLTRRPRGLNQLRRYTDQIVTRLVAEGQLPAAAEEFNSVTQDRLPKYHEAIARALDRHLSLSGEFSYSLELTRVDRAIDPTEDFVLNTKSGHCQRFATALALMLRTQGIPSQFILGYRGSEPIGDGVFEVRENHAHAWVEVLVPAPDASFPPLREGEREFVIPIGVRWLTLDPTPGDGLETTPTPTLLSKAREQWEAILKTLLLAYDRDKREESMRALGEWLVDDNGAYYVVAVLLGFGGLWYVRRHLRSTRLARASGVPTYINRMYAVLASRGIDRTPGQTAREFAASAANQLPSGLSEIPIELVNAYYSERFGGQTLPAEILRELNLGVMRLQSA